MNYEKEIIPIVKEAGLLISRNIRFSRKIDIKSKSNYVTDLDYKIQDCIINHIKNLDPYAVFCSEEIQDKHTLLEYWVLDPIDGTTNLIHKYDSVCISLAHVVNDVIVFGCVYNVFTKELFFAEKGHGSYLLKDHKKTEIHVSNNSIDTSIIGFGCPYNKKRIPYLFSILEKLITKCDDLKRRGPASLDICYVACGRLDAYLELDLELWDFAAGKLILEESGGIISKFNGEDVLEKSDIIFSNGSNYNDIIDICLSE